MAHINHYECDRCGVRTRRITVHKDGTEIMHFCGTLCLEAETRDIGDAARYWLTGQDIRDGA